MDAWIGKKWQSRDHARVAAQNKQLRLVLEYRLGRSLTKNECLRNLTILGIDPTKLYRDPVELGRLLRFTLEEELHLKKTTGAFSSALYPEGCGRDETAARRKKYNAPAKAAQQATRRAEKAARLVAAAETDCRASALLTVLSPKWATLKSLMGCLSRSQAFRSTRGGPFLSGNSLRQAILRELKRSAVRVEMAQRVEKHGLRMHLYRLRS